jgi:hypothetical protein
MSDFINIYPSVPKLEHYNSHAPSFLHAPKLLNVIVYVFLGISPGVRLRFADVSEP